MWSWSSWEGESDSAKDREAKLTVPQSRRRFGWTTWMTRSSSRSYWHPLPLEHIRLANDIISYARESLKINLNQNVYLTLTDHISFVIDRYRAGMKFDNILSDEVRLFYPVEYSVGRYALEKIEERTGWRGG